MKKKGHLNKRREVREENRSEVHKEERTELSDEEKQRSIYSK